MSFLPAVGTGILCALCALLLKESKSPLAPFLTLGGGLLLLAFALPRLTEVLTLAEELDKSIGGTLTASVSKVLATGVLCGVGCDICTELGAPSLASKLDLCGKIEILLLSLPTFRELFSRVTALLT